jgi:hypothetical protein
MTDYYDDTLDESRGFKLDCDFVWSFNLEYSKTNNLLSQINSFKRMGNEINRIVNDLKDIGNKRGMSILSDRIQTSLAMGETTAAYTMFQAITSMYSSIVTDRAMNVQPPDDEIELENYTMGNVKGYPVPQNKVMGDVVVTYLEDNYNNCYNFHKLWQECLRPGSNLTFMDIPSFSICGVYETSNYKQSTDELSELYQNDKEPNRHSTGKTVYPALFPKKINRSNADANSSQFSKVTVTYVRTPIITKTLPVTQISYSGQATISSAISSWLS